MLPNYCWKWKTKQMGELILRPYTHIVKWIHYEQQKMYLFTLKCNKQE